MHNLRLLTVRRLAGDERGATLPEFGFVFPTFLVLLFGIFDVGQSIYVQSVLQGAVQDAGRDAGLESGSNQMTAIDQYVKDQMAPVAITDPVYKITRKNYQSFTDAGRPEDITVDKNNNNEVDPGDCFVDENGSGQWEDDVGKTGLGGANDAVLYTVTVTYSRIFPLWKLIDGQEKTTVSGGTILRNQPYGAQAARVTNPICVPL